MFAVNVGARLDRLLPASRFHYRILALIGGGMFLDAFEYLSARCRAGGPDRHWMADAGAKCQFPGSLRKRVRLTFCESGPLRK